MPVKRYFYGLIVLAAVLGLAAGSARPVCAQGGSDPRLAAAQEDLIRTQIETEKVRQDYYNRQARIDATPKTAPEKPFLENFLNDPADAVGSMGAVIGMMVAFFILMGNRAADRCYRRDMQFHEALRRFGDDGTPAMRAASAGLLARMGGIRERKSYPYLDTAVSQLIAGHRLEENEAVRQAVSDALRELIEIDPLRVRRKLSEAKIKLPGE